MTIIRSSGRLVPPRPIVPSDPYYGLSGILASLAPTNDDTLSRWEGEPVAGWDTGHPLARTEIVSGATVDYVRGNRRRTLSTVDNNRSHDRDGNPTVRASLTLPMADKGKGVTVVPFSLALPVVTRTTSARVKSKSPFDPTPKVKTTGDGKGKGKGKARTIKQWHHYGSARQTMTERPRTQSHARADGGKVKVWSIDPNATDTVRAPVSLGSPYSVLSVTYADGRSKSFSSTLYSSEQLLRLVQSIKRQIKVRESLPMTRRELDRFEPYHYLGGFLAVPNYSYRATDPMCDRPVSYLWQSFCTGPTTTVERSIRSRKSHFLRTLNATGSEPVKVGRPKSESAPKSNAERQAIYRAKRTAERLSTPKVRQGVLMVYADSRTGPGMPEQLANAMSAHN